jgi:hypothetical protein
VVDGRLIFYRVWRWQDAVRSYRIEVDGNKVGVLKPRSTLDVSLPAGAHTCRARIAWTGSEPTAIHVPAGGEVRVLVAPARGLKLPNALTASGWLVLIPQSS